MRRRFGRRRQSAGDDARGQGIDAERLLARIAESGLAGARELARLEVEGVSGLALVAQGETEAGAPLLVAATTRSGGDALLAVLAAAAQLGGEAGFAGEALVLAPRWSPSARRRLALVGSLGYRLRALAHAALADDGAQVEPEAMEEPLRLRPERLAAQLGSEAGRRLFLRATWTLAGLATKHDGALRSAGRSLELVVLARRVAALRADEGGVILDTILPQRSSQRLDEGSLAGVFDRLEGNLRKRLGDRRVLEGEEGLRAALMVELERRAGLRGVVRWPLGGADLDVIDAVAVGADGEPVVAALRDRLSLPALGAILDGAVALRPVLPELLAGAAPPVRLGAPRLVLAAREFEAAALGVLAQLDLEWERVEVRGSRRAPELAPAEAGLARTAAASRPAPRFDAPPRPEPGRRPEPAPRGEFGRTRFDEAPRPAARPELGRSELGRSELGRSGLEAREERPERGPAEPQADRPAREPSERGGRGGRRGRRRGRDDIAAREETSDRPPAPRFEEMSAFDLEEEPGTQDAGAAPGGRRGGRRRGRRRGRGRRSSGDEADAPPAPDDAALDVSSAADDLVDDGEDLALADGLAPLEAMPEETTRSYDDEEETGADADPLEERLRLERDRRRRARLAKAGPLPEEVQPTPPPRPRRAALLAHADRDSLMAALLFARDVRNLDGIWVYPQDDLMTFFRGVATDLRDDTGLYVVGFTASPVRDTLQAASLYRGRIVWIDHHAWPPEDLEGLRNTIGSEAVHVAPGTQSCLPLVLPLCTRRSRFSDKLVDLATGRFTEHDYQRWGRLWWSRLGEIATRSGEQRAALDPLLVGRPSDLAREASRAQPTPRPPEADFVSGRDFRLVHFGGYRLVIVVVPAGLDVPLAARIARERHGAQLSLAWRETEETVVLGSDEFNSKRPLDLSSMVEQIDAKHDWVEALPDEDHVARFRIRDLATHPERVDAVTAEIATGRALLEG